MELIGELPRERFTLGKYEVVKYLAAGGMAEVFLARASGMLGFQKPVVIKRILPHLANRADFISMFLDEARIAMQLQHPNIVQTYDVGVANRSYFIAMEYLHGETVRGIMVALADTNTRLPIEHAVHMVSSIATALHYAHELKESGQLLGIVHRDVTPQNVMVTFDGTVKLLDFGIAKALNRVGETRAGTLKGKLPYMSPEQCSGEQLDRRSDVFSLGIMLYELTLGRRLFRGVSDFQILKQIVEGEVTPPTTLDPDYPPELEAIVLHALKKPRDERYQSARALLVDLEAFSRSERLHTTPMAMADFVGSLFKDKLAPDALMAPMDDDASKQIEISGSAETRARGVPRAADDGPSLVGPDIPITPPFSLEFTGIGTVPEAPAIEAAESTPQRRSPLVSVIAALALVALGVAIATFRRSEPPVVSAPAIAVAPPAEVVPPVIAPSPAPVPVAVVPAAAPPVPAMVAVHPTKGASARSHAASSVHVTAVHPAVPKIVGEGTLVLATTPWCSVSIDKIDRGTTPLTVKLAAGSHALVLTNTEFKVHRSLSVVIQPNEMLRKRLDFDQ